MLNQKNIAHKYAQVNGIRMHYVEAGTGPLLILLHGFPEFWYSWRHQIPTLSEKFRVVAPDMRGYNKTEKPKAVSSYRTENLATDISELIIALGEENAVIVGHDWGGAVAYQFAADYPEMTRKLVVLNCPHPVVMSKHFRSNFKQLRRSWYMFYFQLPWLPEFLMVRNLQLILAKTFRGWAYRKNAFTDEDLAKYNEVFSKPGQAKAAMNYYRAAFRDFFSGSHKRFPKINAPTLVIWGENDRALGKELTFGMKKHFSTDFRIKYIADCSHWVQHDHPELVGKNIFNFATNNFNH